MYYVSKEMEIAGAHRLELDYESGCKNPHGHNWQVTVYCRASKLNRNSMVVDFKKIKELTHGRFDHTYINDIIPDMNPTAENIAKYMCDIVNDYLKSTDDTDDAQCYKVRVQESKGNIAEYVLDE